MSVPHRIVPGPGQESVWDYPRPPRLEPCTGRVEIIFNGAVVARSDRALRILETSHPPTIYIPLADIDATALVPAPGSSFCEWKGTARYYSLRVADRVAEKVGWGYDRPTPPYEALADHVAFYAGPMDLCTLGGEPVTPQPGGFYGGWITPNVVGPFKGSPGTWGW